MTQQSRVEELAKAYGKRVGVTRFTETNEQALIEHATADFKAGYSSQSDAVGDDDPFPLKDVLTILSRGVEILLHNKNYDGPDYEEMEICIKRAKEIVFLSTPTSQSSEQDAGEEHSDPYGLEFESDLMKRSKKDIIDLYRRQILYSNKALSREIITYRIASSPSTSQSREQDAGGLRWVKASERLPEVEISITNDPGVIFRKVSRTNVFMVHTSTRTFSFMGDKSEWEWLDESSSPSTREGAKSIEEIAGKLWDEYSSSRSGNTIMTECDYLKSIDKFVSVNSKNQSAPTREKGLQE